MSRPIIADTGGLLRALACAADRRPSFPEYETALTSASLVIVPGLVLAEVDYFLRRQVYRLLTTDRRDFTTIRIGPRLSRALELLP